MIELKEEKVRFVCGLSDGSMLVEGTGVLKKDGTDSTWIKLQNYLREKNLKISSMSLISKTKVGNRHYHLPNEIVKFQGYEGKVPKDYNCFRRVYTNDGNTLTGYYTVIEAIYNDYRVQLWVSEVDNDKCWVNLVKNK